MPVIRVKIVVDAIELYKSTGFWKP